MLLPNTETLLDGALKSKMAAKLCVEIGPNPKAADLWLMTPPTNFQARRSLLSSAKVSMAWFVREYTLPAAKPSLAPE